MKNRAQGAIEYLLIIGAAILVVAVVVIALTGVLGTAKDNSSTDSVLDAQLKLLILSGSGTTDQTTTINPNGTLITLTKEVYVNSNSIAQTANDLKNAYNEGIILVTLDGTDAKSLGYTAIDSGSTSTPGTIKLSYNSSTRQFSVYVKALNGATIQKIQVQYIDYAYSGETTKGYASASFSENQTAYKVITNEGKILLKRN